MTFPTAEDKLEYKFQVFSNDDSCDIITCKSKYANQILSEHEIVERLKAEYEKFKQIYKNLGGDEWKGTKPRVFEIFESILENKK